MIRGVWLFAVLCLQAGARDGCVIGGTVVDSAGEKPVARARVMATSSYSVVRLTDERGGFCFESLDRGEYQVRVQKAGYQVGSHGVKLAVDTDVVVKPITIRMTRYASLGGTVVDSRGEPVPGAQVKLWTRVRQKDGWGPDEADSADTDSGGAFRFSQLDPGTYYVSVRRDDDSERRFVFPFVGSDGQPRVEREVETFYPESLTFGGASALELEAGGHMDNLVVAFKKVRLRRISGTIAHRPPAPFLTFALESDGGSETGGAIPVGKNGSFTRLGLPPARYMLRLSDGQRLIAEKEVDLTVGDALDVTLDPIETMDVPVTFRTEGKRPAFRPRMTGQGPALLVRDGSNDAVPLQRGAVGSYRFAAVPQGIYHLALDVAGQGLYVKGVTYGGETQTGDKLDLRIARDGGLEVTLSASLASVQGRAVPSSGEEEDSADLTVILVAGGDIAQETVTDQKGRFQMPAVAPGRYRLFAIEGFDDDWESVDLAKALAGKSVEVELKESDNKQVSLTVISAEEWKAAKKGGH